MKSVKRIFLVGLLVAVGLVYSLSGNVPTAAAATVVGCGTTSSFDGEQMILNGNLLCNNTAVTITHNRVHLDMQGHTITSTGVCTVALGLCFGVDVGNGTTHLGNIEGVNCIPTTGVHINGGTVTGFQNGGIVLCKAARAHVNGVTSTNNGTGIRLVSSNDNRINGSTSTSNNAFGMFVEFSSRNVINTMVIQNNGVDGVFIRRSSDNNKITSALITNNERHGVFVDRTGPNIIQGNTITGHTTANGTGIFILLGDGSNIIRGNTASGNKNGIQLISTTGNLVQSNTALNNSTKDLVDNDPGAGPPACANTWKNNNFVTKTDPAGCIQ